MIDEPFRFCTDEPTTVKKVSLSLAERLFSEERDLAMMFFESEEDDGAIIPYCLVGDSADEIDQGKLFYMVYTAQAGSLDDKYTEFCVQSHEGNLEMLSRALEDYLGMDG